MTSFHQISRQQWAQWGKAFSLSQRAVKADLQIDFNEIQQCYLPLIKYLRLVFDQRQAVRDQSPVDRTAKSPFVIGITGSVAVGKSTFARLVKTLLQTVYPELKVQTVSTDGFLYTNAELTQKHLMARKGFPESFNLKLLTDFLRDVSSGQDDVVYPLYSQELSDRIFDHYGHVTQPDILILEGINVLQLAPATANIPLVSDFLDFSIYLDASESALKSWFLQRFERMLELNQDRPDNFYYQWANEDRHLAFKMADETWQMTNLVNLRAYIAPTKLRATLILHKASDHHIDQIALRS